MQYNVRDFGAQGNDVHDDTTAIQEAIEACANAGGGTVVCPAGQYRCRGLVLRSQVTLFLDTGSHIVRAMEEGYLNQATAGDTRSLIFARNVDHIGLIGLGTIDGQGDLYFKEDATDDEYPLTPVGDMRPPLIDFEGCNYVHITSVTLLKSPFWCLHLAGCVQVDIDHVQIYGNLRSPNNDGIDPDSCRYVRISNCHIESADDCIALKTTRSSAASFGPCENIVITNCTLISRSTAVKIGSETYADIRNVTVQNCCITDSNRGVGIWARDGATVENIIVSNMVIDTKLFSDASQPSRRYTWWGKGEPMFISAEPRSGGTPAGVIRSVMFHNIIADCESGVYISGTRDSVVEDIQIRGLVLSVRQKSSFSGGVFDTQPSERGVFPHAIPAIFGSFISRLMIDDIKVTWGKDRNPNWGAVVQGEFIDTMRISRLMGAPAFLGPAVEVDTVKNLFIDECISSTDTDPYVRAKHTHYSEIHLRANSFSTCATDIDLRD